MSPISAKVNALLEAAPAWTFCAAAQPQASSVAATTSTAARQADVCEIGLKVNELVPEKRTPRGMVI
jgi:hypothetical protein